MKVRLFLRRLAGGIMMRLGNPGLGDRVNRRLVLSLLEGYRASALLHAAAKLGIADLLAEGPRTSGELAQSLGSNASALLRFMRGLAMFGICRVERDGRFSLTSLGSWLRDAKPGSLRGHAIRSGETYATWGNILHSIKTGETAFPRVFGTDLWNYRRQEPEIDDDFNKSFRESAERISREVVAAYDFSSVRIIADLGGGYGYLLSEILRKVPHLSGILFDQPHVIAKAGPFLKQAGISERCRTVGGDFFAGIPEGAGLYLLKSVIHDWDDEQSARILANCRLALKREGKLLLLERIMPPPGKENPVIVTQDLRMLLSTGGRERSESEFRAIFEEAGLRLARRIPLKSGFNILEGIQA